MRKTRRRIPGGKRVKKVSGNRTLYPLFWLVFLAVLLVVQPVGAEQAGSGQVPTLESQHSAEPAPQDASEQPAQQPNEPNEEPPSYPRFRLGGHIQFQFDQGSLRSGRDGGTPVRNGLGIFPTDDRISPRRLRLYPTIEFSEKVSLINETDFEPDTFEQVGLKMTPLDLYFRVELDADNHLRFGQAKVPFGYEFFRTSRELTMVERADVSRLWFQRDMGVGVFGTPGRFEYGVGVYTGQGENNWEQNSHKDFAARLVYQVTPQFDLGVSGHLGAVRPDGEQDDISLRRAGIEAHYHNGPWIVDGEYIVSNGYNLFSGESSPARGYYVYLTRQLTEDLDAVAGYDRFDPFVGMDSLDESSNATNERDRYTIGFNYYLSRKPIHRFMLNYEWRNELEGPSVSGQGLRLRYQYVW